MYPFWMDEYKYHYRPDPLWSSLNNHYDHRHIWCHNLLVYLLIWLTVKPLSVKMIKPRSSSIIAGKRIEFKCSVVGCRPKARITWFKGSTQLLELMGSALDSSSSSSSLSNPSESGADVVDSHSPDLNVTISTLTFIPEISDNLKYISCRAENPIMGSTSGLEEATQLIVNCENQILDSSFRLFSFPSLSFSPSHYPFTKTTIPFSASIRMYYLPNRISDESFRSWRSSISSLSIFHQNHHLHASCFSHHLLFSSVQTSEDPSFPSFLFSVLEICFHPLFTSNRVHTCDVCVSRRKKDCDDEKKNDSDDDFWWHKGQQTFG